MKIFDCFLFYNEIELLELRFEVLYNVVDKFILVEANKTFSGQDKPFNFEKNKYKYVEYLDKIIYIKVEDSPSPISKIYYWNVEFFQRNCITRGLEKIAQKGDYVLVSDVDEIVKPETLINSLSYNHWVAFEQSLFYYFLNVKQNNNFIGPVLARYGTFRTPQQLRQSRFKIKIVKDGGWHFSFLGGAERIKEKISSYAETQTNNKMLQDLNYINSLILNKKDIFGRKNISYSIVPIDESYPSYILTLIKKYPYLLFDPNLDTSKVKIENVKYSFVSKSIIEFRKVVLKIIIKFLHMIFKRKYI